jgi:hypothetical protein
VAATTRLAAIELENGRHREARTLYGRAVKAARLGLPIAAPLSRIALNGQAIAVAACERPQKQSALLDQVLEAARRSFGKEHVEVARVLDRMVVMHAVLGEFPEAAARCREALAVRRSVLRPDHPHTADNLNRLASMLCEQGDPGAAVPLLEEALEIRTRAFGASHAKTRQAHENLAAAQQMLHKTE